ncbi:MAG: type II toxin-antitoxin system VapC family toxin [Myxococcales bacterium]|nr:type II toxin-antitoxin system VapC family toxin [Myxococcales bacterium]
MRIALDTNAYADAARRVEKPVEILRTATEIHLPFIALGELRAGFAVGNRGVRNEAALALFLQSPRVRVLFADEHTATHYARLYAYLRKKGTPVPTNDLWIAALVVQHDLVLLSNDEHFRRLPQLPRI